MNENESHALERYARLEIPFADLRRSLSEILEFDFRPTEIRLSPYYDPLPSVRIQRWHIENALEKAKQGEISRHQLSTWADMLLLIDAYDWEGPEEDWIADQLNALAWTGENPIVIE